MSVFIPIEGNFIINGTTIRGGLSKQSFFSTISSTKFRSKLIPTPPYEEFILTPLTMWNNHFTAIVRFQKDILREIILFWLDGDLAGREDWEDIVNADLAGDFESLSNLIERELKIKPFEIKHNMKKWRFSWGEIQIWWEDTSYTEGIAFSWNSR